MDPNQRTVKDTGDGYHAKTHFTTEETKHTWNLRRGRIDWTANPKQKPGICVHLVDEPNTQRVSVTIRPQFVPALSRHKPVHGRLSLQSTSESFTGVYVGPYGTPFSVEVKAEKVEDIPDPDLNSGKVMVDAPDDSAPNEPTLGASGERHVVKGERG
jgi:hypothetical protein